MKPDWDKLMKEYSGHKTILVADVDCTTAGKPLCDSNGVKGFPTIKHGDPSNLEDYKGGRDFSSLSKFAAGLKPLCSPSNMDLCDDEQKAIIEGFMAMDSAELDSKIKVLEDKAAQAETTFNDELEKLQNAYKKLQDDKEQTLEDVKKAGVGMMKAVRAAKESGAAKTEL